MGPLFICKSKICALDSVAFKDCNGGQYRACFTSSLLCWRYVELYNISTPKWTYQLNGSRGFLGQFYCSVSTWIIDHCHMLSGVMLFRQTGGSWGYSDGELLTWSLGFSHGCLPSMSYAHVDDSPGQFNQVSFPFATQDATSKTFLLLFPLHREIISSACQSI